MCVEQVGDEGAERRKDKSSGGFLSVLRRGYHQWREVRRNYRADTYATFYISMYSISAHIIFFYDIPTDILPLSVLLTGHSLGSYIINLWEWVDGLD